MTVTYETINFQLEDGLARVSFNRPDVLNSLNYPMLQELMAALDVVQQEESARALLISAAGRAFCAGADLTAAGPSEDPDRLRDVGMVVEQYYNPLIFRLANLRVPIVVAVNGAAVGAGCSIAIQGDVVVAGRSAYFLQAFSRVGLVPDAGATWMLPRLVGMARAKAMTLLAERVSAEEAERIGLIHKFVEDEALVAESEQIARRLAAGPTVSYQLIRETLHAGLTVGLADSLLLERQAQKKAGYTSDYAEGVRAFREKRSPRFDGR